MDGEFRRSHPEGSNAWRSAGPKLDDFPATQEFQAANEEYSRASLAYWNSEDGLSQQRLQREYRAMFGPDGTFRIDDVPPGEYTVKVDLVRPPKLSEGNPLKFTRIAALETDVTIPDASGPSDDTPVSLGLIELSSAPQKRVGK